MAGRGKARHGFLFGAETPRYFAAGRGMAWQGEARPGPARHGAVFFRNRDAKILRGLAWPGGARLGPAGRGEAWHGFFGAETPRYFQARRGAVGPGSGLAWLGLAGRGMAWQGKAWFSFQQE